MAKSQKPGEIHSKRRASAISNSRFKRKDEPHQHPRRDKRPQQFNPNTNKNSKPHHTHTPRPNKTWRPPSDPPVEEARQEQPPAKKPYPKKPQFALTPQEEENILPILAVLNRVEPHLESLELLSIFKTAWEELDPEEELKPFQFFSKYGKPQGNEPGEIARRVHEEKTLRRKAEMAQKSVLDTFLEGISRIIREQNGQQMQEWLVVEPPFLPHYNAMINELRTRFPSGSEESLDRKCTQLLPEAREGLGGNSTWIPFIKFMVQYLIFLRDVDASNLLETYNQLSELVQKANSAFKDPTLGILLLGTIILYCKLLARLAIGLDKQPHLIAGLAEQSAGDESVERLTLPERAANTVREAFSSCTADRSEGASGKKAGIYTLANLCLKILFQCKKTRSCYHTFNSIYASSPPLHLYPASQRVTFLYYLGRFHFSTSHFYRAQLALQSAYDQCPVRDEFRHQKRLILIYLLTSNIILGRMPSDILWSRREAHGLRERFVPLCSAIKRGDLTTFRRLTDFNHEHAQWFIHFRIFLQLRNRCEVLVWRSLVRKVFLLNGEQGGGVTRAAPNMQLSDIVVASQFLEKRALNPMSVNDLGPGRRHTNWLFMQDSPVQSKIYADPEFEDTEPLPPEYTDSGKQIPENPLCLPDMFEIESIVASLIDQGLLNGFIAHRLKKFAILGAKAKPALQAGFPNPWEVVSRKFDGEVPGWKRSELVRGSMVYNLSGVKEIGSGG